MAHFEKYTISQVGGLLRHYTRENENYSNDSIDPSKTALNYNLCDEPIKSSSELKNALIGHCESLHGHLKSNAVAMVDLVITLPKDEPDEKAFFKACYECLDKRFSNVINASVHLDETTPHLHFAFAPITDDNRLCAKQIINRNMLRSFHQELEKEVSQKLGHEVHLLNGATSNGHKEVLELKIETLKKEKEKLEKEIDEKKNEMKLLDNEYDSLNNELKIVAEKPKQLSTDEIKNKYKKVIDENEFEKVKNEFIKTYEKYKFQFTKEDAEDIVEQIQEINKMPVDKKIVNLKELIRLIKSIFEKTNKFDKER